MAWHDRMASSSKSLATDPQVVLVLLHLYWAKHIQGNTYQIYNKLPDLCIFYSLSELYQMPTVFQATEENRTLS